LSFDQAFTKENLKQLFRKKDFKKVKHLKVPKKQTQIVDQAISAEGLNLSNPLRVNTTVSKGKTIYSLSNLSDDLLHRKASKNLRVLTRVKQSNRQEIVSNLILLLEEGLPYRIYKLDIRKFYESIENKEIIGQLDRDPGVSKNTTLVATKILTPLGQGLPRGLEISAVLAERQMREFDRWNKANKSVYFYSRFVDDIIILTSSLEDSADFLKVCGKKLPSGTEFNQAKEYVQDVAAAQNGGNVLAEFNYLGYQFKVSDPENSAQHNNRFVQVDISPKKITKIKTKIAVAVKAFLDDGNFDLLLDRMQFLSSNYKVLDHDSKRKTLAGIYYNYRHIQHSDFEGFCELDKYVRSLILGCGTRLSQLLQLHHNLSDTQRRMLLKKSFRYGHRKKVFSHFKSERLAEIKECWANV
jgi:hypothetical protein